jgi:hypothetical protein
VLTLRGAPHQITLPVDLARIAVKCRFTVPYVQWGLKKPGNMLLKVTEGAH